MSYRNLSLSLFIGLSVFLFMPEQHASAQQVTSCIQLSRDLARGSTDYTTNGDVSRLQAFLGQQGYFPYQPVGSFGPITFQSVQNFQAHHGIPATGYVGPLTRGAIQQITCQGGVVVTPPVSGLYIQTLSTTVGTPGSVVTVYGSGFTSSNAVILGSTFVSYIPSYDGRTFSFAVPNLYPGTYNIYIQNTNGTSNALSFTIPSSSGSPYYQAPYIQSLSATSGPVGTLVTVQGSGFGYSNTVIFNGTILSANYASANTLTFIVPNFAPGTYGFYIQSSNGNSNSSSFTVTYGGGVIQTGLPITIQDSGSTNASPFTLTVNSDGSASLTLNGQNSQYSSGTFNYQTLISAVQGVPSLSFQSSCMKSVSFGTTITVMYNGQTSGDVTCPPASQGQGYITLQTAVNAAVQQVCSYVSCMGGTVVATTPSISTITPSSGGTGTFVTIYGSGFTANNSILITGGAIATNVAATNNGTALSFTVPNSISPDCFGQQMCPQWVRILTPGTYSLSVRNSNGISNAVSFTYSGN